MNKNEFCWWLHGWMEIEKPNIIRDNQLKEIKNHLTLAINGEPKVNRAPIQYCGPYMGIVDQGLITC